MTVSFDDVLIVIPCLDEEAHLPGLLEQLIDDNPGARIVVADGGSTDRSREIVTAFMARAPGLRLMDNPAMIQSAGVNLAVERDGGAARWLVRIDAHCVYPRGYVGELVRAARTREAVSVVVPMVSRGRTCFQRAVAAAQNSHLGTGGSAHRHVGASRFVDHGHHALMDAARFAEVGGYDERMTHNEDAELDRRLHCAGGRIWLDTLVPIVYFPRSRAAPLFRQYWNYGRGRAKTRELHGEWLRLRQVIPLAVPAASVLLALAPWLPLAALPIAAWAAMSLLSGALLGWKSRAACDMLAGVPAMIMHFAWGWGFLFEAVFGRVSRMLKAKRGQAVSLWDASRSRRNSSDVPAE